MNPVGKRKLFSGIKSLRNIIFYFIFSTAVVLTSASLAGAYIITSSSDATLESLNPSSRDTLIIASGHTVRIVGNWNAGSNDTTCLAIFVREGGTLRWTGGARANLGALWLGGLSGSPFSSSGGGIMYMGASDTLGLWNTGQLGSAEFHFRGNNCEVNINGTSTSSRAVIMGMTASSRPIISTTETTGEFNADFAKFYRLGEGITESGIRLGSWADRPAAGQRFSDCVFDSTCLRFVATGAKIANCSLFTYQDYYYPIVFEDGDGSASHDTVWNCYIQCDNNYSSAMGPDYGIRIEVDSCVIYGSTLKAVRVNGDPGRMQRWISFNENIVQHCVIRKDTIDGAHHGIFSAFTGATDVMVDSCVIRYNTHENILLQEGARDSAWTFQANVFYGTLGPGYVDLLVDKTETQYLDFKILYNTFCNADTGGYPIQFRNHGSGSDITFSGVKIVGNICVGDLADIRVHNTASGHCYLICDDFKYNAYYNLVVTSGNSISVAGSAYNIVDSNYNTQTNYGFVDSVNFDFRLSAGSPLIGAGETNYGCEVFYGGGCSDGPFNVGYYQTLDGEPQIDTIPPAPVDDLGASPGQQGYIVPPGIDYIYPGDIPVLQTESHFAAIPARMR